MNPSVSRTMAETVEPETLQSDLERYCALARESGAAQAVVLPAGEVVVDERVRLKCLVPRCLRAGETPNCPPNAPDLDLVRSALGRFSWAILFKCDVGPLEDYTPKPGQTAEEKRRVLSYHRASSDVVYALEGQAYKDGYHLAMGFGGGSCKDYLCQGNLCQFLDSGRCRFPHRSRPAMEAMGIDVLGLIQKVGWQAYALTGDLDGSSYGISVGIVFIY
jgi:predicted metal-binding protein